MRDLNKKSKKDKKFTFDNVFGQESTNQEIFEGTTKVTGVSMEVWKGHGVEHKSLRKKTSLHIFVHCSYSS